MSRNKSTSLRKNIIGWRRFGDSIDVTDPCYNKDVWCRVNGVKIIPGDYMCVAWEDVDEQRVRIAGIYLGGIIPASSQMKDLATIGVDAGLAGFFENKPDYNDKQWDDFCNEIFEDRSKNAWITKDGFFTESGYGDGVYDVRYATGVNGGTFAVEIIF